MVVVLTGTVDQLAERNAENTMGLIEGLVDTEVNGAVSNYLRSVAESNRDLMELYYRRFLAGELTEEEAYTAVSAIFLDPEYGRIGTTGYLAGVTSGGILAIHPLSPGVDASGHEFMQQAMAMRNGYLEYEWQNVGEDAPRMKAGYLSYFEPWDIMVWASSYKSEFFSLIDTVALDDTVGSIRIGADGYAVMVDADGRVVAGEDRHSVTGLGLAGDGGTHRITSDGEELLVGVRPYEQLGWSIVVVSPLAEYRSIVSVFRIIVVVSIVLAAIVLHLIIRTLIRRKLRPVGEMKLLAEGVSAGDLTGRVTRISNDEIGDIAGTFNDIVGEFSGVLGKMKRVISVLSSSIQNLSTSAQEIASTSNEQAAAVKEVLSTMEDVDQTSRDILVKVEEVAKIANATKSNVERGFELIKTSLGKMEEIRTTNSDTITGIKILGERIESIWEIVNIINGIADQTKIIAFNAELEAAAAGEAGKNFQIVAGEIRRLADGTVNSTNEIKTKINEIQHASDKLIVASEDGTQKIAEGFQVSTNIRGVFEEVLSSSEISATSAGEISRSTKMQVSSFEQIFLTLKQISEAIDSFVESTNYTNEVSDQLSEIADSFEKQVEMYTVPEIDG
jgi:methyl-accepting chemotaxis protein